ncbi:hypothetical protein PV11_09335 [Exophiala sideris]|uniref:FAD-binding domain-containing protein n=1 Tax=Exophiala sideris TaxID=1016849 RepID=A0A0D1VNJ8_9EURO|nr:hypothetical protein PV11_09335 [Exophiala sideris]
MTQKNSNGTSDSLLADPSKLRVIVVGAGIGGLTTAVACKEKGFTVTVLEATEKFTHIGAGLQISPNSTRVLLGFSGMRERLDKVGAPLKRVRFHDIEGNQIAEKLYEDAEKEYGFPTWMIHRGDLHDCILAKARELDIDIRMGQLVEKFDGAGPSVTLNDGSQLEADVIVCGDGYRSRARSALKGRRDEPLFSGNSAFRALIPCSLLQDDDLFPLINWKDQSCYAWVGGTRFIVAYPVRQGEYYNFVSTQPAIHTKGSDYVVNIDSSVVVNEFADWDPRLVKILKHLPEKCLEWKLCDLEPMDNWALPGGKITLLGDAAHAVLPSSSQGAALAIEDAGAFAEILSRIEHKSQIEAAVKAYEDLRRPRTTKVRDSGRRNVARWKEKDSHEESTNDAIWDYDVIAEAKMIPIG